MADAGERAVVALLTPPGKGGVHVIWLRAPRAGGLSGRFRPRGARPPAPGRIAVGDLVDGDEVIDEVVVLERVDGATEIHCHGGPAVADRIVELLESAGAVRVPAAEALLPGLAGDAVVAEAYRSLVDAETDLAARMLAAQAAGALSRRLEEIAALDGAPTAAEALDALLATAPLGRALVRRSPFGIVGPPNAGKSTLLNALVGYGRAIVHDAGGTTRDQVREATAIGGLPVELVDTPGLRETGSPGEARAIARTDATWAEGRPAILCLDGTEPEAPPDLLGRLRPGRDICVLTKADLPARLRPEALGEARRPVVLSARTGEGMDRLRDAIRRAILGKAADLPAARPGADPAEQAELAVVFSERQEAGIGRAAEAYREGDAVRGAGLLREVRSFGKDGRPPESGAME